MSNVINKINLYIDSKNKHQGDTTNNFKFIIPDICLDVNQMSILH